MTLTKIADDVQPRCTDPQHSPPAHTNLMDPGIYQWKCPACMHVVQFRVIRSATIEWNECERQGKVIVGTNR